jgi:predicted nuclease of predicted toxin-antitoxin system
MNPGFYFDEMMSRITARGLVQRGCIVITAADVGMLNKDDDSEHLPYAREQGLVLVTFDQAFPGVHWNEVITAD